ncbi:MAG: hypothetical protein A3F11_10125 [Gammaproteobacteria bacterium RIFCSPHIGHO2_12_FULL_37_14]|nr:MAG: hypothetical protein A3F11_10125 [Gammaproteobacteria bacterium RIFCSPHIGHO2_12_FULL_37_14]
MLITDRDVEILNFINEFGFCEMPQIEKKFGVKTPRSYKVMQRLVKAGLVNHERVFHNRHGAFYLTNEGAKYTHLPAIFNLPKDNYKHQLTIMEVYFKLIQLYPTVVWVSERVLKRDKFTEGIGKSGHIPDGKMIFPDNREIAIEVELTLKSKRRLEQIFRAYGAQFKISEVWYFCSENIVSSLARHAAQKSYIKIHKLEELL